MTEIDEASYLLVLSFMEIEEIDFWDHFSKIIFKRL